MHKDKILLENLMKKVINGDLRKGSDKKTPLLPDFQILYTIHNNFCINLSTYESDENRERKLFQPVRRKSLTNRWLYINFLAKELNKDKEKKQNPEQSEITKTINELAKNINRKKLDENRETDFTLQCHRLNNLLSPELCEILQSYGGNSVFPDRFRNLFTYNYGNDNINSFYENLGNYGFISDNFIKVFFKVWELLIKAQKSIEFILGTDKLADMILNIDNNEEFKAKHYSFYFQTKFKDIAHINKQTSELVQQISTKKVINSDKIEFYSCKDLGLQTTIILDKQVIIRQSNNTVPAKNPDTLTIEIIKDSQDLLAYESMLKNNLVGIYPDV